MKEATARIKINKLLEAVGWRFFAEGNTPANIRLEPSVTIKSTDLDAFGDNFEKTAKGFVDFLLLVGRGQDFDDQKRRNGWDPSADVTWPPHRNVGDSESSWSGLNANDGCGLGRGRPQSVTRGRAGTKRARYKGKRLGLCHRPGVGRTPLSGPTVPPFARRYARRPPTLGQPALTRHLG